MSQRLMKAATCPQDVKRLRMVLIGSKRISGIAARKNQRKASLLSLSFAMWGNAMRLIAHHGLTIGKNIATAIILWHGAIYQTYYHRAIVLY